MKQKLTNEIEIPEGINVLVKDGIITVKGKLHELKRNFNISGIDMKISDGSVILSCEKGSRREKRVLGSIESHIKNMFIGANSLFVYKLKVCSGHFPMTVTVKGNVLSVKNFLGEKVPRTVTFSKDSTVLIEGDIVTVESANKEIAGQTAASIEKVARAKNKDRRIFQDGIYITQKAIIKV